MFGDDKKNFRLGCSVLVVAMLLILGYVLLEKYDVIRENHVVLATFDRIPPIEVGGPVMMAGIVIGEVQLVDFTKGQGTVTVRMKIETEGFKRISNDSEALATIDPATGRGTISITPSKKVDVAAINPVKHVKGRVVGPQSLESIRKLLEKLTDEAFLEQLFTLMMQLDELSSAAIPERLEKADKRIEALEKKLKMMEEKYNR